MKKLLLLLFLIPNLAMGESYLCIAEAAGGVEYLPSQNKYEGKEFFTDSKIIFKKELDKWTLSNFGEPPNLDANCSDKIVGEEITGVYCSVFGGDYILNFRKLRYRFIHYIGWFPYIIGKDIDTPVIEVGKCSSI
jgi:hypothetical protein